MNIMITDMKNNLQNKNLNISIYKFYHSSWNFFYINKYYKLNYIVYCISFQNEKLFILTYYIDFFKFKFEIFFKIIKLFLIINQPEFPHNLSTRV